MCPSVSLRVIQREQEDRAQRPVGAPGKGDRGDSGDRGALTPCPPAAPAERQPSKRGAWLSTQAQSWPASV